MDSGPMTDNCINRNCINRIRGFVTQALPQAQRTYRLTEERSDEGDGRPAGGKAALGNNAK